MKKIFVTVLCTCMLAGIFTACSTNDPTAVKSEPEPVVVSNAAESAPSAAEKPPASIDAEAKPLSIAILIPGLLGDKSFFDATNEAKPLLEKELGATVKVIEMGTDQKKWYPTFVDYCEQDIDLIITVAESASEVLTEAAIEFPDQKFMNIQSGSNYEPPANVYAVCVNAGEMSYLAGVAAALKAKEIGSDQIGFIGGMDIPGINEFLVGYIYGAQQINPDIKVAYSYVGAFNDPSKAKENALVMYQGASVIYQAAGGSGLGVFNAAKEKTQKGTQCFAIGVDSDQAMSIKESDPDAAKLIITSAVKKIPEMTLGIVQRYVNGEIQFGILDTLGLKEQAVGIAKNEFYMDLLSDADRNLIDDIEARVISGELEINEVSSTMSTEEVDRIRNSVKP